MSTLGAREGRPGHDRGGWTCGPYDERLGCGQIVEAEAEAEAEPESE